MSKSTSSGSTSSTSSSSDSSDVEEKLEKLVLEEETEINILLLGETGVGKSTFINSFANYLCIKYFNDAERKGLVKLIPAVYKIRDKDNKEQEIKLGPKNDENECLKTGESATQNVKTYVFSIWKGRVKVRLIDTPGMGDTRGVEQDEINCENIINCIKKMEKIHAVCFLCKPTNARKTVYFDYCVYQILSHLESDAAKNIFFLFTNTRGSNYGPGDTFLTLKAIIKNVEDNTGVQIPLEKNMYCFDNEGFKFLGACEKNVQFDQSTRKTCQESWVQSAKMCWNFVKHLQQNIKPYVPSKLLDVNLAKRILFQFCKVLVEISEMMADTQVIKNRMEENTNKHIQTISELKKAKTTITDVDVQQWSQPILVCTSIPSCAEVYKINGVNKTHYKNVCHYCFDLDKNNIQMFITGSPDITNCENIDKVNRRCTQCGCDFLLHIHIDYTTTLRKNLVVDDDAAHHIAIKESLLNDNKEISSDIQMQIDRFKEEYEKIKKMCVNLSRYLKEHAIVVFSVSYKNYIDYLINHKQVSGTSSVSTSIDTLRKLKNEYEVAQRAFEEYLNSPVNSTENFNFDIKDEHFRDFFQLSQYGKKLEDAYILQKKLASTDFIVKEYVHKFCYIKEHDIKRNQRRKGSNDHDNMDRSGGRRAYTNQKPYDRQDSNYQHPFAPGHPPGPYGGYATQPYPPNYNYTDSNYFQGNSSQSYGRHPPPLLGHHPPPLLGQHPPLGGYPQEASSNYGYIPNYMQSYSEGAQRGQQDFHSNDGNRTNYRDRKNDGNKNRDGRRNKEDNSDSDDSQNSSASRRNDGNKRNNENKSKDGNRGNYRGRYQRNYNRGNYGAKRNYDRNKEDYRNSGESRNSSVDRKSYGNRTKEDNRDSDDSQNSSVSKRNYGNRNRDGNRGDYRGRRNYGDRKKDDCRNSGESRSSSVDRKSYVNRNKKEDKRDSDDSQDGSLSRRNYGHQSKDGNRRNDDNKSKDENKLIDGNQGRGNRARGNRSRGNPGRFRGRGNYGDRKKEDDGFVFLGTYTNDNRKNDSNRGHYRGGRNDSNHQPSGIRNYVNRGNPGVIRNYTSHSNSSGITSNSSKITSNQSTITSNSNRITSNPSRVTIEPSDIFSDVNRITSDASRIISDVNRITSNSGGIRNASNQSNPGFVRNTNPGYRGARHSGNPTTYHNKNKSQNDSCNVM